MDTVTARYGDSELDEPTVDTHVAHLQSQGILRITQEMCRGEDIIGSELEDDVERSEWIYQEHGSVHQCLFTRVLRMSWGQLDRLGIHINVILNQEERCSIRLGIMLEYWKEVYHLIRDVRVRGVSSDDPVTVLQKRLEESLIRVMDQLYPVSGPPESCPDGDIWAKMRARSPTDTLLYLHTFFDPRSRHQLSPPLPVLTCGTEEDVARVTCDVHAARRLARRGGIRRIPGVTYDMDDELDEREAEFVNLDAVGRNQYTDNWTERIDKHGKCYRAKKMSKECINQGPLMYHDCEDTLPMPKKCSRQEARIIERKRRREYEDKQQDACGLTSLEQADRMVGGFEQNASCIRTGTLAWAAHQDGLNPNLLNEVAIYQGAVLKSALERFEQEKKQRGIPSISHTEFGQLRKRIREHEQKQRRLAVKNGASSASADVVQRD